MLWKSNMDRRPNSWGIFPHTTRQHLLNNITLCIQEIAVCPSDSIVHTLKVWSSQGVMVFMLLTMPISVQNNIHFRPRVQQNLTFLPAVTRFSNIYIRSKPKSIFYHQYHWYFILHRAYCIDIFTFYISFLEHP